LLLLGRAHALLGDWDSALGALNQVCLAWPDCT